MYLTTLSEYIKYAHKSYLNTILTSMPLISKAEELASNTAEYIKNKTRKPNKWKKLEDF